MKRALHAVALVACGKSAPEPAPSPPPKPITSDAARAWPSAPAPTLPPELAALPWPPSLEDVRAFDAGVPAAGGTAYGVTIPTSFPRVFVKSELDLLALEAAWGKLARDHAQYAVWWNPAAHLRARHDVPHPTPSLGRGLELAPYVSTIDRIANIDEMILDVNAGTIYVPPGEWDPAPVAVTVTDAKPGRRVRFTVRVDGPPVDEAAVLAKLREIYGVPTEASGTWTFGRVTARRVALLPAVEITYLPP